MSRQNAEYQASTLEEIRSQLTRDGYTRGNDQAQEEEWESTVPPGDSDNPEGKSNDLLFVVIQKDDAGYFGHVTRTNAR